MLIDLFMDRRAPVPCRLMTWEYCTTFDGDPSASKVLEEFLREMPRRVELAGGSLLVKMWPMVSFNATEGRLWRYLVALPSSMNGGLLLDSGARKSERLLPEQISLAALANKFLMEQQNGNSGNCVFWALHSDVLYLLVYFEGRLCHWSEEPGYVATSSGAGDCVRSLVDDRLARFRKFLEQDSLFSRAEHFDVVELQVDSSGFSLEQFRDASRDPFFRGMDLKEAAGDSLFPLGPVRKWPHRGLLYRLPHRRRLQVVAASLALFVFALVFFVVSTLGIPLDGFGTPAEIPDAIAVELDSPPMEETVEEPQASVKELRAFSRGRMQVGPTGKVGRAQVGPAPGCVPPSIKLRGIAGEKLAIAEVNGRTETLSLDDSLSAPNGAFVISGISRDRLILKCRGKTFEVPSP